MGTKNPAILNCVIDIDCQIMKIVYFFILICLVICEKEPIDCSDHYVVRAINVCIFFSFSFNLQEAEQAIKASLPSTVVYHVDHALKCKVDSSGGLNTYYLSLYGLDTTKARYVVVS